MRLRQDRQSRQGRGNIPHPHRRQRRDRHIADYDEAVEDLNLKEGMSAYAIIKSSDVMVGTD